jgi:hypothetical protein
LSAAPSGARCTRVNYPQAVNETSAGNGASVLKERPNNEIPREIAAGASLRVRGVVRSEGLARLGGWVVGWVEVGGHRERNHSELHALCVAGLLPVIPAEPNDST